jgi:hypothetical protein
MSNHTGELLMYVCIIQYKDLADEFISTDVRKVAFLSI